MTPLYLGRYISLSQVPLVGFGQAGTSSLVDNVSSTNVIQHNRLHRSIEPQKIKLTRKPQFEHNHPGYYQAETSKIV